VVAFDEQSPDFMSPATLARDIGLRQVVRVADGAVWAADQGTPDSVATGPAAAQRPR
jgi:hypothetical protein